MLWHWDTGNFACLKKYLQLLLCLILDKILFITSGRNHQQQHPSFPQDAQVSLDGVCFRLFSWPPHHHGHLCSSTAGSRTVKMKCWQLLLWSKQEKWKRLLKYPSHCTNVNGRAGRVTSVKVCEGKGWIQLPWHMSSAEAWPETTCSSHRWRGLVLIMQHANKQSQIILTQEKH